MEACGQGCGVVLAGSCGERRWEERGGCCVEVRKRETGDVCIFFGCGWVGGKLEWARWSKMDNKGPMGNKLNRKEKEEDINVTRNF